MAKTTLISREVMPGRLRRGSLCEAQTQASHCMAMRGQKPVRTQGGGGRRLEFRSLLRNPGSNLAAASLHSLIHSPHSMRIRVCLRMVSPT